MEPATNRFFSIPELVHYLSLFLNHKETSGMMQTCRKLNELYTPALYYDVLADSLFNSCQILSSEDSIKALARNTHHVRQLTLNIPELVYYVNCIIAYQDDALQQGTTDTTTNDHLPQPQCFQAQRPLWLAPPDPRNSAVFPIPPMTQLTMLVTEADLSSYAKKCPFLLPTFENPKATLTYICWIMDLNPNLLDINLDRVIIKDQRDIRLLTSSIFGLKNLQNLCLEVYHKDDWVMPSDLPLILFLCCPASLQSFYLSVYGDKFRWESGKYFSAAQGQLQSWEIDEAACSIPATYPRRQGPLLYLTTLSISDFRKGDGVSENELTTILKHCPNLTNIGLPRMSTIRNTDYFAEEVAQLCPNLSGVRTVNTYASSAQKLAVRLLETLPGQQIKVFSCESHHQFRDPGLADLRWHFLRHSSTLRSIIFSGCQNYDSRIIQVILVQCVVLEILSVSWNDLDTQQQLCINLEDAIEFPWGCTRIQKLKLTIAIPDEPLHHIAKGTVPYYNRSAPIALSTAEKDQFKSLEALYRQIGSLAELHTLDLQAIFYDPQGQRLISKGCYTTFPGMLSLGCEETGRPGFLHHLAGLTKLKHMMGAVSAKTKENQMTVGTREVEWVKQHWPMVKSSPFP